MIALDAAVERAAFYCANHQQIAIGSKESLHSMLNKLAEHLAPDWDFTQRNELTRLHSARNKAQHEGLYPAQEHMPAFLKAAQEGVVSLVLASTGKDVTTATLTDAIQDENLRQKISSAMTVLNGAQFRLAVESANEAFSAVSLEWTARRAAVGLTSPTPDLPGGLREFSELTGAVKSVMEDLQEVTDSIAFSGDPAEFLWFRHLVSNVIEKMIEPTESEARRAVAFVFEWILRYEQLAETLLPNRLAEQQARRRRVRASTSAGPARVHGFRVISATPYSVTAEFYLSDVPAADDFSEWQLHLASLLTDGRLMDGVMSWWRVDDAGVATVIAYANRSVNQGPSFRRQPPTHDEMREWFVPADHFRKLAIQLTGALSEVESVIANARAALAREREIAVAEEEDFRTSIEGRLPSWVQDLTLYRQDSPQRGRGKQYAVKVVTSFLSQETAPLVSRAAGVSHFYLDGRGSYILGLIDPEGDPVEILRRVEPQIIELSSSQQEWEEEVAAWQAEIERTVEATLGLTPGPRDS